MGAFVVTLGGLRRLLDQKMIGVFTVVRPDPQIAPAGWA
jgi:hypothetical protein